MMNNKLQKMQFSTTKLRDVKLSKYVFKLCVIGEVSAVVVVVVYRCFKLWMELIFSYSSAFLMIILLSYYFVKNVASPDSILLSFIINSDFQI